MRIGQDNIGLVLIIYRCFVTIWDSYFFDCICNCFSGCLDIRFSNAPFQSFAAESSTTWSSQDHLCIIELECWLDGDHLGRPSSTSCSLLLWSFKFSACWSRLLDLGCLLDGCVAFWNIDFFDCIVDNLASFLSSKFEGMGPFVICWQFNTLPTFDHQDTIEPWLFWTKAIGYWHPSSFRNSKACLPGL